MRINVAVVSKIYKEECIDDLCLSLDCELGFVKASQLFAMTTIYFPNLHNLFIATNHNAAHQRIINCDAIFRIVVNLYSLRLVVLF